MTPINATSLGLALAAACAGVPGVAQAADPTTTDCLSASEASVRSAADHRLRAERVELLVCASMTCPSAVRSECLRQIEDLKAQIPTIVFAAKDRAGDDLTAVRVTMDGEVLAERLDGSALSIDPGEHTFQLDAAGYATVVRRLVVHEAEKERQESVTFAAAGSEPPVAGPSAKVDAGPIASPAPASRGLASGRLFAIASGVVGLAGVGVGSGFGLAAIADKDAAAKICPDRCATQAGVDRWHQAVQAGTVSTIAFAVGGVALAAGIVLWVTAPGEERTPRAQVGIGPSGVQIRGAW